MKQKSQTLAAGADTSAGFDVAQILDTLIEHKAMIAITAAIIIALGAAYAFLTPPVYQTSILIKVDDTPGGSGQGSRDLLSNVSPMFDEKSSAEGEMQLIRSKLIAGNAVDQLKLDLVATPHYFPLIGNWIARRSDELSKPGILGMGGFAWGKEAIEIGTFDVPEALEGQSFDIVVLDKDSYRLNGPALTDAVKGKVGVNETFPTLIGSIQLRVAKIEGKTGASFEITRHSRQQTIDALQKRLQVTEQGVKSNVLSVTLQGADPVLLSATLNEIGGAYVRQNGERKAVIAKNSLAFLENQLPAMQRQLTESEDKYSDYRNQHALLDMGEEGRIMLRQSADGDSQLLDLRRKRQDLASRFSPSHPNVLSLDQQIAATQHYLDTIAARVRAMPLAEQTALRLMRDVKINTDLFSALRNNIEELRLIEAGKVGSVQLIDHADVPRQPVKPVKSLVLVVSAVFGVLLGTGLAFAKDILFKGVTDPREVESVTALSVYATVPFSDKQRELTDRFSAGTPETLLLALHYPKDPTIESLRIFRSALQFAMLEARNKIVMLAGPLPEIGKSFVTANLAHVLATGGKRVLLVDGDLRKGYLHRYFGMAQGVGLADVLAKTVPFESAVRRQVARNLDFLQNGLYPPNPAELLIGDSYREFIEMVDAAYDIVLIDGAAILAVSDAGIMAPSAGSIFLVARYGKTRVPELLECVKRLAQTGVRANGVLLNGFVMRGGSLGYTHGYGSHAYVAHNYEASTK
jgi:tyrosine-protein kinase Etk/Wzc